MASCAFYAKNRPPSEGSYCNIHHIESRSAGDAPEGPHGCMVPAARALLFFRSLRGDVMYGTFVLIHRYSYIKIVYHTLVPQNMCALNKLWGTPSSSFFFFFCQDFRWLGESTDTWRGKFCGRNILCGGDRMEIFCPGFFCHAFDEKIPRPT